MRAADITKPVDALVDADVTADAVDMPVFEDALEAPQRGLLGYEGGYEGGHYKGGRRYPVRYKYKHHKRKYHRCAPLEAPPVPFCARSSSPRRASSVLCPLYGRVCSFARAQASDFCRESYKEVAIIVRMYRRP